MLILYENSQFTFVQYYLYWFCDDEPLWMETCKKYSVWYCNANVVHLMFMDPNQQDASV